MPLVTTIARAWPPILFSAKHLLVEVIHHDLGLEPDRVVVALDVAAQLLLRLLGVELRVVLDRLDQPVVAVDRRVVLEHVEDEALLDRLLHRVAVERPVLDLAAVGGTARRRSPASCSWRGGEGEVAGVVGSILRASDALVSSCVVHRRLRRRAKRLVHRRGRLAALAGVRLVDDDGETSCRGARRRSRRG